MIGMGAASATRAKCCEDAGFVGAQPRAMVGRHQHQHGRAGRGGDTRPLGRDARAEMAARDNHRNAPGHVREAQVDERRPLVVGQQELLGIIGEHADAVHTLVDHAIEHAPLAVEIEIARHREGRGRDGIDAAYGVERMALKVASVESFAVSDLFSVTRPYATR